MKKNIFLSLIFLFVCSCLVKKKENNLIDNINFSDELTFEEFNYKLEVYSKISNYPDINE